VRDGLEALAKFLAQYGTTVNETARPEIDFTEAHGIYVRLLRGATSRTQTFEAFQRNLHSASNLDRDDQSYFARMIRGNTIYYKDWLDADEARHRMRYKWLDFFNDYDLLLCPAAASAACPHDSVGERHQRTIFGRWQASSDDRSTVLGRRLYFGRTPHHGGTDWPDREWASRRRPDHRDGIR
jgi:amidase